MDRKSLEVLEFDKITEQLASEAVTSAAKARARELMPECDVYVVEKMQRETAEAESMTIKKGTPPLQPIGDVRGSLMRAEAGGVLLPRELLNCAHMLRIAEGIASYIDEEGFEENYPTLSYMCGGLFTDKRTSTRIISAVISEDEIADDASGELLSIRRRIKSLEASIRKTLDRMIKSASYGAALQDAIVTMRSDRYVVPVKSENRSAVPGIVHDSSASGQTLFVEPMAVVEINNKIREIRQKEKEEIERILAEFSALVASDAPGLRRDYEIISSLDFAFAKARLAIKMNAVRPEAADDGITDIKKGRHPLIDRKTVVPTDIYIGGDFDTLVITGPNTGGKTVALKTLGLLTLMAQAGLHIPASGGSRVAVFDNVFADIGDEQSIEQSLSTFSAHMVNIVRILKEASYSSLVLFDELGAGTDPTEGAALAVAILERMKEIGAKTAATTHYSEIKLYALETDRVENAACEFDVTTLKPTYRLLIGVPGKSNAFAISKRLGLEEDIISRARRLVDGESTKFEDVITSLEETRKLAELEREEAHAAKVETEAERERAERERASIEKQRENMLRDARRDAKRIYEQAKREADEIIKEMRDLSKNMRAGDLEKERQKLKRGLESVEEKLSDEVFKPKNPPIDPKKLLLGQSVIVTSMNSKGKLLSLPDKAGNLSVQVGILKITTNISALRLAEDDKPAKKKGSVVTGIAAGKSMSVSPEVDLRGQSADEAIINLDKYLDDALLSGLNEVRIIHGKGTGVLRSAVWDYLKRHKRVISFRRGEFGEGDSGVTVVQLQ